MAQELRFLSLSEGFQLNATKVILVLSLVTIVQFSFPTPGTTQPITLAEFDFDDGNAQPDPQGWRPLALGQQEVAYFHVDDFTGVDARTTPLAGSQSMWCGLPAEDPRTCHWDTPPGYGSNWAEYLVSTEFAVQGDVTLSFLTLVEIEPTYDFVLVQYEDPDGQWVDLDNFSCMTPGCVDLNQSYVIPAAEHDGTIRFRFYFDSDGCCDSENSIYVANVAGFVVDDLTVSDGTGVIDFQDFESESIGSQVTTDGSWHAEPKEFYHGGFLANGANVLQESSVNDTNFWAFFDGSTRDFGCAGHPEQLVPEEILSFVRSPMIDLYETSEGNPIVGDPDSVVVEFDVYRDISESELKGYTWDVQGFSNEPCLVDDRLAHGSGFGDEADWYRQRVTFEPGPDIATIQIELGLFNYQVGAQECRSHSPLIDNVTVMRYSGTVTGVQEEPRGQKLVLYHNHPNPFTPGTTISFLVPPAAERVSLRVYDSAGRLVRTLVEGTLPSGRREVYWDGRDDTERPVASGVYYSVLLADELRASRRMVLLR
jgi:hypothetical protein